MNLFDIAAVLVTMAAVFSYINHRLLKLPSTTGILSIALMGSLLMLGAEWLNPALNLRKTVDDFLRGIDFNDVLMHGMLCFLLFAGALHLRFEELQKNRWTILSLALLGVILSTFIVGGLTYLLFSVFGFHVAFLICLIFGALISPTDPIAVLGLLKQLRAPKSLEATIAGESLFNDGVGVVLFLALVSLSGLEYGSISHLALDFSSVAILFFRQVAGGVLLGLLSGYTAYRALRNINYPQLELLITLALVMFTYSISFKIDVSGPIAVVVCGLLIGNQGKRFAMSDLTAKHVGSFWGMTDEILNAVLFLLIGLLGFDPHLDVRAFGVALAVVPVVLGARYVSVLLPISVLNWNKKKNKGLVEMLTWGGLRGGLSIAMVLSLPHIPEKELLMTCTYAVVLFSVLVQGLSMRKLLVHYGVGK